MADYIAAANGLVATIANALTPDSKGRVALAGGAIVKMYVGWPDKQTLDADLAKGVIHISVWPLPTSKTTSITQNDMGWVPTGPNEASRETRRQTKQFQVSIWANTPGARDTLGGQLDAAMSDTFRFVLADGSGAILGWRDGRPIDDRQTANLYRRDTMAEINFATIRTMTATPITQITTDLTIMVTPGVEIATVPITTTAED